MRSEPWTEPAICRDALNDYRTESNPAKVFLTDYTRADAHSMVASDVLYGSYTLWAKNNGFPELNSRQFGKEIRRVYPKVERVRVAVPKGRIYCYIGLAHDPMSPMPSIPGEDEKTEGNGNE